MRDAEAFRNAICDDENVRQLLDRLAFVERFHAVIVKCEIPRVANALVDVLLEELGPLREQAVRIQRWDPYCAHSNRLEPVSVELLVDEVLGKLLQMSSEPSESFVLTIVDASRAMPRDDDAWGILLQRMNERRNAIVRAVPGACLFLTPKRYDVLFARTAPDFWSIVGAVVDVPTPPIRDTWKSWFADPILLSEMVNRRLNASFTARYYEAKTRQDYELVLQDARAFVTSEPASDVAARFSNAVLLLRAARSAQRFEDAANAERFLDVAIERLESMPQRNDDPQIFVNLAVAYSWRASLYILAGRLDAALDDLSKTEIGERHSMTLEPYLREMKESFVHERLLRGNVLRVLGKTDAAIADFLEGITILRGRVAASSVSAHDFLGLADALADLGHAYCDQGNFDSALSCCDEARGIMVREPDVLGRRPTLRNTLMSMIRVQFLRGDTEQCITLVQEGINEWKYLIDVAPNFSADCRGLGMFYVMMAEIQEQCGQTEDAVEYDRLALETLEPLIKAPMPDPIAVKIVAAIKAHGDKPAPATPDTVLPS